MDGDGARLDLDEAMKIAVRKDHRLHYRKILAADARGGPLIASVAVDHQITQVVDGAKGGHGMIPKSIFKP
jgi:acetamidase/formamidase